MVKIAIECNPDEALAKALGFTKKYIYHQYSKGEVLNFLIKNPGSIGIVDEDPGSAKPSFINKFQLLESRNDIDVYIMPKENTKLIVLKPRLEGWILNRSKKCKINPEDYSLPSTEKKLHEVINQKITQYENLLKQLIIQNCEGIMYLKQTLNKK